SLGAAASTNLQKAMFDGDLNWSVLEDKVGGMDSGIEMPRKKLLYRNDNRYPLGIVGSDYTASDPKEFVTSQFEFAEFIKGKVERVGFIADRSRAFSFVRITDIAVPSKQDRKLGDVCGVYLYSADGWDGGTPRTSRLYVERLA